MITRMQAVQLFGSVKLLQRALKLKTHSAIYMWPKNEPIPPTRFLQIRYELRPDAFDANGKLLKSACHVGKKGKSRHA